MLKIVVKRMCWFWLGSFWHRYKLRVYISTAGLRNLTTLCAVVKSLHSVQSIQYIFMKLQICWEVFQKWHLLLKPALFWQQMAFLSHQVNPGKVREYPVASYFTCPEECPSSPLLEETTSSKFSGFTHPRSHWVVVQVYPSLNFVYIYNVRLGVFFGMVMLFCISYEWQTSTIHCLHEDLPSQCTFAWKENNTSCANLELLFLIFGNYSQA